MNASTNASTPAIRQNGTPSIGEAAAPPPPTIAPHVDVYENDNEMLLWADVPGAQVDGFDVQVDKGELTLSARRTAEAAPASTTATALETEQRTYDYYRVFAVPPGIDASKIEAELRGGVLKIRLPKSEARKARKIEVKGS
jgi:HSP20 family protein